MKKTLFYPISVFIAIVTLTACGQMGPLYLPDSEEANKRDKDVFILE